MRRNEVPASVVLASASPERRRLLQTLISDFEVVKPLVDEDKIVGEEPEAISLRRAKGKALEVRRRRPDSLIIAADTVVACGGQIMGKPTDRADAHRMLRTLTSAPHRVVTAVCVASAEGRCLLRVVSAEVRMRNFSDEEIDAYLQDSEALKRAGAYALVPGDPNIVSLHGSESCVMGLPVEELGEMLDSIGALGRGASSGQAGEREVGASDAAQAR